MIDILLHVLGGAAIFAFGALFGLVREYFQHDDVPVFPLKGWLTKHRLHEGIAWGAGALVIAAVLELAVHVLLKG